MASPQTPAGEIVPVHEYIRDVAGLFSHIAHGWELHSALLLSPAEERIMVREPAQAVPSAIAKRLGVLRVLVVPYVGCFKSGDAVCFSKPVDESHTAVWVDADARTDLVLASKELDAHDTGFEFLASIAQLLVPKLTSQEHDRYRQLLEDELNRAIRGEIDKEALEAKESYLKLSDPSSRNSEQFSQYLNASAVSTLAEYMHGLWHDVQIRVGPEHLPVPELRRRMMLLAELFPPNPGYGLFARELQREEDKSSDE
jgi:hypothetical protein